MQIDESQRVDGVERLRAAYERGERVSLRELGAVIGPDELRVLIAHGLELHADARQLVDLGRKHLGDRIAREVLEALDEPGAARH